MIESWDEFYKRNNIEISWPIFEREHDEFLHAVGSISHFWNFLEDTFFSFLIFSKIPNGVAEYLGFKLNNQDKTEIMKILSLEFQDSNPEILKKAKLFFKYSTICSANRNYIIHGKRGNPKDSKLTIIKKSKKIGQYSTIVIDIKELRQMSQDMYNVAQFGARLQSHMLHFPSGFSQTATGKITPCLLLEEPPKPISHQNLLDN